MTPPAPGTLQAVVFDFDGTLFDASDAICHSFNEALRARGRPALPRDDIARMIGRPLVEMFAEVDPDATPDRIAWYVDTYRAVFHPICLSHCRPLPGLDACLDALGARCALAIATNRSTRGARVILAGFGFQERFPVVVGIEDVTRTKPDPEAVRLACARLGVAPGHAAMVGDTPEDMMAGRAAGARTVGITTGRNDEAALRAAGAHTVVADLAALPARLLD